MAQQNEKQPKAKTGLARCLELASGHKGLVFRHILHHSDFGEKHFPVSLR